MVELCVEPIKKSNTVAYHSNHLHRDFEEDDENPDWVSELKKHVGWKDTPDGNPAERVPEPCGGDTDAWKRGDD